MNDRTVRITAQDNTASAINSAGAGFRRLSRDIQSAYHVLENGALISLRAIQQRARATNQNFEQLRDAVIDAAEANIRLGRSGAAAGNAVGAAARGAAAGMGAMGAAIPPVVRGLGVMAARALSVAAAMKLAKDGFMGFAQFDTLLRQVQNQTGLTRASVDELGNEMMRLSHRTGDTKEELLKAFEEIREAGNFTPEETKRMLPDVALAAKGVGANAALFGRAMGDIMRNFKIPAQEAQKVWEGMSHVAAEANIDISKVGAQLSAASESMSAWGYKGVDGASRLLAFLGTIKEATGDAGTAASTLTRIISGLGGKQMADALGFRSVEAFRDDLLSSGDALGRVVRLIAQARDQYKVMDAIGIRDTAVMNRLRAELGLMDDRIKGVANATGALRKGLNITDGPEATIKRLNAALKDLNETFGAFVDALGITKLMSAVTEQLADMTRGAYRLITLIKWALPGGEKPSWFKSMSEHSYTLQAPKDHSGKPIVPYDEYMAGVDPVARMKQIEAEDKAERAKIKQTQQNKDYETKLLRYNELKARGLRPVMPVMPEGYTPSKGAPGAGGGGDYYKPVPVVPGTIPGAVAPPGGGGFTPQGQRLGAAMDSTRETLARVVDTMPDREKARGIKSGLVQLASLGGIPQSDTGLISQIGKGPGSGTGPQQYGGSLDFRYLAAGYQPSTGRAGGGGLGGGGMGGAGPPGAHGTGFGGGTTVAPEGGGGGGGGGGGRTRPQAPVSPTTGGPGQAGSGDFGNLPLFDPISGKALSGLGEGRGHQGSDIAAPHGTPISAAKDGEIVKHSPRGTKQGDAVTTIKHPDGTYTRYMHHNLDPNLKVGMKVKGGQVIGTSGTANKLPHLHYETWVGPPNRRGSRLLDPRKVHGWNRQNQPQAGRQVPGTGPKTAGGGGGTGDTTGDVGGAQSFAGGGGGGGGGAVQPTAPGTPGVAAGGLSGADMGKANEIYRGLRDGGFSHNQAMAYLGHSMTESGLGDTTNPREGAAGLIHYRGSRLAALKAFAASRGERGIGSRYTQALFGAREVQGGDKYETGRARRFVQNPNAPIADLTREFGRQTVRYGTRTTEQRVWEAQRLNRAFQEQEERRKKAAAAAPQAAAPQAAAPQAAAPAAAPDAPKKPMSALDELRANTEKIREELRAGEGEDGVVDERAKPKPPKAGGFRPGVPGDLPPPLSAEEMINVLKPKGSNTQEDLDAAIAGRTADPLSRLGAQRVGSFVPPNTVNPFGMTNRIYGAVRTTPGGKSEMYVAPGLNPVERKLTYSHEGGHVGSREIDAVEGLRGMPGDIEESRQRQADLERIKAMGPQAMRSSRYRRESRTTREFLKKSAETNPHGLSAEKYMDVIRHVNDTAQGRARNYMATQDFGKDTYYGSEEEKAAPGGRDERAQTIEKPVNINMNVNDNQVQFARRELLRTADNAAKSARMNTYSDIGTA